MFYWLVAAALLAYSYCLSTLFSKSRIAGTSAALIYAISMIPGCVSCASHGKAHAGDCGGNTTAASSVPKQSRFGLMPHATLPPAQLCGSESVSGLVIACTTATCACL